MIRLCILTCTKYKKSDLATQTATTSKGQAGHRTSRAPEPQSLKPHAGRLSTMLVLAGCTDQREVKMFGHEFLELSGSKQLSTLPGP